ncbi:MAG: hypothetical protein EBU31_06080 [Proteobacteria bacterium]|nr:hypothetical protein [Pseudomonadota bacterium]
MLPEPTCPRFGVSSKAFKQALCALQGEEDRVHEAGASHRLSVGGGGGAPRTGKIRHFEPLGAQEFHCGRYLGLFSEVTFFGWLCPTATCVAGTRMNTQTNLMRLAVVGLVAAIAAFATGSPASAGPLADGDPRVNGWGYARVWWQNNDKQCDVPGSVGAIIQIASGNGHVVALQQGGTVRAWGDNARKQCTVPADLGVVTQVAAGGDHNIALAGGVVRTWGYNAYGQCDVPGDLGTSTQVAAGQYFSMALRQDGTVRVWGYNVYHQCDVPVTLEAVTQVAAGQDHCVALLSNKTIRAWGQNSSRQCTIPDDLPRTVSQVAAGSAHTVALLENGTVRAWGRENQCAVPDGLGAVIRVAAGWKHSIALESPGTVRVWGDTDYYQHEIPSDIGVVTAVGLGSQSKFISVVSADATDITQHIADQAADRVSLVAAKPGLDAQVASLQGGLAARGAELAACQSAKAALEAQGTVRSTGDLDNDGSVGQADVEKLLRRWGPGSAAENTGSLKDISRSIKRVLKAIKLSRRNR